MDFKGEVFLGGGGEFQIMARPLREMAQVLKKQTDTSLAELGKSLHQSQNSVF